MREHGALSRVAVGWGENTVGESAPSELASCFVGGTTSERVEKKRGSHGPGFRVAGPPGGCGSVAQDCFVQRLVKMSLSTSPIRSTTFLMSWSNVRRQVQSSRCHSSESVKKKKNWLGEQAKLTAENMQMRAYLHRVVQIKKRQRGGIL